MQDVFYLYTYDTVEIIQGYHLLKLVIERLSIKWGCIYRKVRWDYNKAAKIVHATKMLVVMWKKKSNTHQTPPHKSPPTYELQLSIVESSGQFK